jgi:hypothetical protein
MENRTALRTRIGGQLSSINNTVWLGCPLRQLRLYFPTNNSTLPS